MGGKGDEEAVCLMYEGFVLSAGAQIEKLEFQSLGWGDEKCNVLSQAMPFMKKCKSLNLRGNGITNAGLKQLTKAFRESPALLCLNLFENKITAAGAGELLEVLLEKPNAKIDLRWNDVEEKERLRQLDPTGNLDL